MFPMPFYLMACLMLWSCHAWAEVLELSSPWYQAPEDWRYQNQTDFTATGLRPVNQVNLTGGHFWKQVDFEVNKPGRYVLDFKNNSIIGHFRHIILDAKSRPIADMQGGIQSREVNPFFLRHGREIGLAAGRYRLLTELRSVFFFSRASTLSGQPGSLPTSHQARQYCDTDLYGNVLGAYDLLSGAGISLLKFIFGDVRAVHYG